jgi:hypothetical protein
MRTFTITLTPAGLRTFAVALAEEGRRRPVGDKDGPTARGLARSLSERVGQVAPVLFTLSEREAAVAKAALRNAEARPGYYGALLADGNAPSFGALAAQFGV